MKANAQPHLRRIRLCLWIVIAGLFVSGITAFPLQGELAWLDSLLHSPNLFVFSQRTGLLPWIATVHQALAETNAHYPFLAYGTDWLAFAHLILALLFFGTLKDPVRNKWVLQFGLISCIGVLLLALIAGPIRSIPLGWRLMDCSFGVAGCIPILIALRSINRLEN